MKHNPLLIKICGLRDETNIEQIAQQGPEWLGFIYSAASPRDASGRLNLLQIKGLSQRTPPVRPVAVFVNTPQTTVISIVREGGFTGVQLHGAESVDYCRTLKQDLDPAVTLIKAFGIGPGFDFSRLNAYSPVVDFFLFDTQSSQGGGTGTAFDWDLLKGYTLTHPYILSGGLDLDRIHSFNQESLDQPEFKYLAGFDLNSQLEEKPGYKNIIKTALAIEAVKSLNQATS